MRGRHGSLHRSAKSTGARACVCSAMLQPRAAAPDGVVPSETACGCRGNLHMDAAQDIRGERDGGALCHWRGAQGL
jgi:hypothetical protein